MSIQEWAREAKESQARADKKRELELRRAQRRQFWWNFWTVAFAVGLVALLVLTGLNLTRHM